MFALLHQRFGSSKVPGVDATFWGLKLLTTAMGEATSDFLVHRFSPVLAVLGGAVVFALVLGWQLSNPRYLAAPYWSAVAMVGVFGTMCADVVHVRFAVAYVVSSAVFALALVGVFASWWLRERTLSIHSIVTSHRELFYWSAVTVTFALGTAAGDTTAYTLHWGFWFSGIVFMTLFVIAGLAYRFAHLNAVGAFWAAYVLTRPFGASFADWLGVSHQRGGMNWGPGTVGVVLSAVLVAGVARRARRERVVQNR